MQFIFSELNQSIDEFGRFLVGMFKSIRLINDSPPLSNRDIKYSSEKITKSERRNICSVTALLVYHNRDQRTPAARRFCGEKSAGVA